MKLVESVQVNARRYIDVFSEAVDAVMPRGSREFTYVATVKSDLTTNWEQVQRRCPRCDHVATRTTE